MQSKAATVAAYLAELPPDRRAALKAVRAVVLDNLDGDFQEQMQYGMIGYCVPHRVYPPGYHCDPKQPLPFAGLASQKNHMSLYLMSLYGAASGERGAAGGQEEWFRAAWAKTGKKLDMGKCCIRFKTLDDLALDVIGEAIRRVTAAKYVEYYESAVKPRAKKAPPKKAVAKRKPISKPRGRSAKQST